MLLGRGTDIIRNTCSWVGEHISPGICVSLGRGRHFSRDMCFTGRGTHISRDTCSLVGEHIPLGIFVSQVGEHISQGICVSQVRNTYD